ncbi:hypothetical protein CHU95_04540 [Niveispirillum lacus]|uniref:Cell shape determination protein CcmA n=1 Tax=Niveispirillum lacus TaxID=1981099 RepID=A0A255Z6G7_9PROT|nr:polymer-forming cytoskeletal protein [Niveispirillum lacus]OYQ36495.1 hypothetical protein CHU95_04540 [Niveispirillum lacus]
MFAKVKERIDSSTKPAGRPASGTGNGGADRPMPSIVSRDMRVMGNLDTPGEVHVEGIVDGDIRCTKLIIGATGTVNGHILATTVRVHGQVRGEINAEEVFILNGSTVQGDVVQTVLEIAPGASFEGGIRRRQGDVPAAMLAAPVAPPVELETDGEPEPLLLATQTDESLAEDVVAPVVTNEPPEAANSGDDLSEKKVG